MNEATKSKILEVDNITIMSELTLVNGDMRKYIRRKYPEAKDLKGLNFSAGSKGEVVRFKVKGFIVLYLRNWLEVPDLDLVKTKAERLASWIRLIDDNILITIKREAKNG